MATPKSAKKRATPTSRKAKTPAKKPAKPSAKTPAKRPNKPAAVRTPGPKKPSKKSAAKKSAAKKPSIPKRFSIPREQRPTKDVTRDLFLVWRAPRVGVGNPQRMTNASWQWLVRNRELNAWAANKHFDGPPSLAVGPCWCFNRFGRSETALPDGRVVSIAGEHEDHYDPDFYIYNDVVVTDPSGAIEVYGYSREVFPPTDFHSATLDGERIVVIGCLGYPTQRVPGETPVYALDTGTFAFTKLTTTGDAPGWIFEHTATRSDDGRSITVRGGRRAVTIDGEDDIRENIDDWSLDLATLAWTRLTERRWTVWELSRADGQRHDLMTTEWMSWHVGGKSLFDRQQLASMGAELGYTPDFALYASRFTPPVAHTPVEPNIEEMPKTVRITVDGVTVRYVEESFFVRITIEGTLPKETVATIIEDARAKLELLEHAPWTSRALEG